MKPPTPWSRTVERFLSETPRRRILRIFWALYGLYLSFVVLDRQVILLILLFRKGGGSFSEFLSVLLALSIPAYFVWTVIKFDVFLRRTSTQAFWLSLLFLPWLLHPAIRETRVSFHLLDTFSYVKAALLPPMILGLLAHAPRFLSRAATIGLRWVKRLMTRHPNAFALSIGMLLTLVILFVVEGLCRLSLEFGSQPEVPARACVRGYTRADPVMGYRARARDDSECQRHFSHEWVYHVPYSIGADGRRKTPFSGDAATAVPIFIFGGSYVYGEGVFPDETLPYFVGELSPSRFPVNYGLSGYGPQNMLARLESGEMMGVAGPEAVALYVFIGAHVERVSGSLHTLSSWGHGLPFYEFPEGEDPLNLGTFDEARPALVRLCGALSESAIVRRFHLRFPPFHPDSHYRNVAALVARSRDLFFHSTGSRRFAVLIFPGENAERLLPHLKRLDIPVLDYSELLKPETSREDRYRIRGDGHPGPQLYLRTAQRLVEDLERLGW